MTTPKYFEFERVSASNLKELLIRESILIQQHRPDINFNDTSLPLFVFNN